MNTKIIDLDCTEWDKETWREAYAKYCQHNMFGPKTKQEYYDMTMANFKKLANQNKPLSDELKMQWLKSWRSAVSYARAHKCDMNGCALHKETASLFDTAHQAKEIAVDTAQRLDYLIKGMKGKRVAHERTANHSS